MDVWGRQLCSVKICMQSKMDKCVWMCGVASCVPLRFVCRVKWTSVCVDVWTRSIITVCLLSREKPAVTLGCQLCSVKICMQSEMDNCLWMFVRGVSALFACYQVKSLQSPWVASYVPLRFVCRVKWTIVCGCVDVEHQHCLLVVVGKV